MKKRLDIMVERLANVAEDRGGTLFFSATDLNRGWAMRLAMDGTIESLQEGIDEEAATSVRYQFY